MFDSDLNVFYSGGSGGFYFLHCVLMLNKHFCWFPPHVKSQHHNKLRLSLKDYDKIRDSSWLTYDNYLIHGNQAIQELVDAEAQWAKNFEVIPGWFDQQFDAVHEHNWNINTDAWKSSEIWPCNTSTLDSKCVDRPYRIFFTCMDIESWLQWPGKKLVFYTDVRTQLRLAMYKKALKFQTAEQMWPTTKNAIKNAKNYNGDLVSNNALMALKQADRAIKLQDFVKQMLADTALPKQKFFTQQWLSYHPEKLLDRCGLGQLS